MTTVTVMLCKTILVLPSQNLSNTVSTSCGGYNNTRLLATLREMIMYTHLRQSNLKDETPLVKLTLYKWFRQGEI